MFVMKSKNNDFISINGGHECSVHFHSFEKKKKKH